MHSGRELDKVSEAGLTPVEGDAVDVPGMLEAPLTLECRVVFRQKQDLDKIDPKFMNSYPQDVPSTAPLGNRDAHIAGRSSGRIWRNKKSSPKVGALQNCIGF